MAEAQVFLEDFNGKVNSYVKEVEELENKNKDLQFKPNFWLQNNDFTLARDVFLAASGSIAHEVTKFSLVYTKTPSQNEASSICKALAGPCEQLLSATKVALFCGAGSSLAHEIIRHSLRVLKSVRDLSKIILSKEVSRVPELTGRVWEACEALKELPKSNCIASKRNMLQCVSMLNDTMKELNQVLEEHDASAQDPSEESFLTQVEDEDEYDFDSSLSSEEKEVFVSTLKLFEMMGAILKRGILTLKKLTIEDSDQDLITWTFLLDRQYVLIHDTIVDAGASLYPPIDLEELSDYLEKLEMLGLKCLEILQTRPQVSQNALYDLDKGHQAFLQQVATVKQAIQTQQT